VRANLRSTRRIALDRRAYLALLEMASGAAAERVQAESPLRADGGYHFGEIGVQQTELLLTNLY